MSATVRSSTGYRFLLGVMLAVIGATFGFVAPAAGQQTGRTGEEASIRIPADTPVESLFADFLHYARMGRFRVADAYARALLSHPELDPVEILELANSDQKSVDTLLILIEHSSIGENAVRVLELIHAGEHQKRQELDRIQANIENLAKGPQQEYFAIRSLAESGEHAIPPIVATLLDPSKAEVRPRLITALTKLGKPAVTPLTMALAVRDNDVRVHLIRALGEIGYPHAIPYLQRLTLNESMPEATKQAAAEAIDRITAITGRAFPGTAADHFFGLAEKYYNEDDMVRADPRVDTANVWYWDESAQTLTATVVPERIFGSVMALRCCEVTLNLQPDRADATALWLAANTRREHRLGMDIESGDPNETGEADATRPAVFPRALYFTQAAGPRYAHLVLARAVKDQDAPLALGAIEALRVTAGATSLVGTEDLQQPLVQALRFPDLIVRIRAALALAAALPKSPFADAQFVMPVLADTVTLTDQEQILVIDADQANLNRVMEALRAGGRSVVGETNFHRGLERARTEFQTLRGLFISTDVAEPGLALALQELRSVFVYSKTPVVVLTKPRHSLLAEDLAEADGYVEPVDAAVADADLVAAFVRVRERTGQTAIDADLSLSFALEAVETLRRIAVDGRTVYDVAVAEPALVAALASPSEDLQTAAATVLALIPNPTAQQAVGQLALDAANPLSLRVAAFDALAESAKRHGNLLAGRQVTELISISRDDTDLTIRTAASQALGAVNLPTSQASGIIRSYHGG